MFVKLVQLNHHHGHHGLLRSQRAAQEFDQLRMGFVDELDGLVVVLDSRAKGFKLGKDSVVAGKLIGHQH